MTGCFTQSDLIRYIYQEMDENEIEDLVQALHSNESLMQDYLDMLSTMEHLDYLLLEPSDNVVKRIKKRSKPSGVQKV